MKPDALLRRLLDGRVKNVSSSDTQRLLHALGFEERRVKGSHHGYVQALSSRSTFRIAAVKPSPYQLRQIVALVRQYDLRIEEDP